MSREKEQLEHAEDLRRLKAMLERVAAGDATGAALGKEELRILNLACGECREAEALTDFFAGLKHQPDHEKLVKLVGMDVREREIADAKARFRSRRDGQQRVRKEFEFLAGDASQLEKHKALGESFDAVFLRHQNLWNGQRTWEEIFDHALSRLNPEGNLIITSYFDQEHQQALEVIQRLGGELVRTARNPDSRDLPTPGKSVDRHVAIFRRKK